MFLDSLADQVLSLRLLDEFIDCVLQLGLNFLIQAVLTWLHTFNLSLHVLDVKFGFNFSLIDSFLFLKNFVIVLKLLFRGFIFGFPLRFRNLFNFNVQLFLLSS